MIGSKRIVILCTSRIFDSQVHDYIEQVNKRVSQMDAVLLIFAVNADIYWKEDAIPAEASVFDIIPYELADVVIIMDEKIKCRTVTEKVIANAKKHNLPVLVVDGAYENASGIVFDYKAGFENIVRHAFEKRDIKRPHIMAGIPNNKFSDERIDAFKKVITEYGFTFDESMVSYGLFWAVPAVGEAKRIIASGNIPDALFCANDIMAINVSKVFQQNGYLIPDDLIITGFDGLDEVFMVSPKITTAACLTPAFSDATVDYLEAVFDGTISSDDNICTKVLPIFVPNESTGDPSNTIDNDVLLSNFNFGFYRHQDDIQMMYKIIMDMQASRTPEEMVDRLNDRKLYDQDIMGNMLLVLNKNCFRSDEYYFDSVENKLDPKNLTMYVDMDEYRIIRQLEDGQVILSPENVLFSGMVETGNPLIFNSLDYMNIPMGYVCYNYEDCDNTRYTRTASTTGTLCMGIGGYINMSYQKNLVKQVNDYYEHDLLTGLYNRNGFNRFFDQIQEEKKNSGIPVTIIMYDLDGLKAINDNFGHEEGDRAIATLAASVKKSCPEGAFNVRFGGDEIFSVIIGECEKDSIIKKIDASLDAYNETSGKDYRVLASYGIYNTVFDEDFNITEALGIADKRMYEIKKEHHERYSMDVGSMIKKKKK